MAVRPLNPLCLHTSIVCRRCPFFPGDTDPWVGATSNGCYQIREWQLSLSVNDIVLGEWHGVRCHHSNWSCVTLYGNRLLLCYRMGSDITSESIKIVSYAAIIAP